MARTPRRQERVIVEVLLAVLALGAVAGCVPAGAAASLQPGARPTEATHEQSGTIAIPMGDQRVAIHSFCLAPDGNLLAACGGERMVYTRGPSGYEMKMVGEPSGIRVIGPEGKLLATWPLDVTPQAVNVAPDGTVYCGGQGRLAKLDPRGKVLQVADAPQVAELPPLTSAELPEEKELTEKEKAAKEAKVARLTTRREELLKDIRALHKERTAAKDDEARKAQLDARYEKAVAEYRRVYEELRALTTTARQVAMRERSQAMRRRAVNGIAVTARDVFVVCPTTKGYGYDIWRLDRGLANGKKIVTGLRGCCGQMDIQAAGGKVFAAENSRKRVVCYDRDGKQLAAWGKADRDGGIEGFGSCCNPMNLRIGPDGAIYTSEASLGRIKRYSPSGEFLGLVGTSSIVPGCKHVAIGVSRDGGRVYLLDITRAHIVVLTRRKS